MREKRTMVLLHNIRSAHNVGSIFRTADAAGVEKILLTGYTPRPVDRFGRLQKDIAKTPQSFLKKLKVDGWAIVGVEQDVHAEDYRAQLSDKKVFIFGNEVRGISRALRAACDRIIEIPMRCKKESLNVAVTAGIVLFR